jgi:hypothetical protein
MTWAPDSWHILLVTNNPNTDKGDEIYLVNLATGEVSRVLENLAFPSAGYLGLAWSPTGQAIALVCPLATPLNIDTGEFRLCIIPVEAK